MEIGHHSKAPVLDLYNGSRAPAPPKSGSNDLFSLNIIENSQGPQDRARTKVPFVPPLFLKAALFTCRFALQVSQGVSSLSEETEPELMRELLLHSYGEK